MPSYEVRYWRLCAESTALVASTAAQRGVSHRFVTLMWEDAARYAKMADDLEKWENTVPWLPRSRSLSRRN